MNLFLSVRFLNNTASDWWKQSASKTKQNTSLTEEIVQQLRLQAET